MKKLALAVALSAASAAFAGSAHAWSYLWPFNHTAPFMTPYQTDNLNALKAQRPHAVPFNAALQREYAALGEEALAESDHQHADMYIRKGFAAGTGMSVLPEDPRTWWLPGHFLATSRSSVAELYEWHGKLIAALGPNRTARPGAAARAQAMYDCWVEEEHEDVWMRDLNAGVARRPNLYQPQDIAKCKNAFFCAMAEMGVPVPIQCVTAQDINFRFDQPRRLPGSRADLWPGGVEPQTGASAPAGAAQLDALIAGMRANPASNVQLKGHTDTVGGVPYNLALSERRALLIRAELTRAGINPARITFRGVGKAELAVPTPDQTRDVRNRRVSYQLR
jgi:OOP family OmpA-OmpF porin